MSYVIAGTPRKGETQKRVDHAFDGFMVAMETGKFKHDSPSSFVYCKSDLKVIPDIFINLNDSESWIVLVGAPILNAKRDDDRQEFAKAFFLNPVNTLREQVDGHYGIIAYDSAERKFHAASDWNSLIPIYFAITKEGPIFSNAELPLAALLDAQYDQFGFAQAIHYGSVWGSRTRFSGIQKLQPCELLTIESNHSWQVSKYWEPRMETLWNGSFDDVMHNWLDIMRATIGLFVAQSNGHEVSTDLTAGEDSRMVAALLHDIKQPFRARVSGYPNETDVVVAKKAAAAIGVALYVEDIVKVNATDLDRHVDAIINDTDAYGSFFTNALAHLHGQHYQPWEYNNVHLCGLPGGGQFRGANYLRAKLLNPSSHKDWDYIAYIKRKFLLDHTQNILTMPDVEYFDAVNDEMKSALDEVKDFPAGTQVDHLARVRYGCLLTDHIKRPFYFAFGTRDMARSTYTVPPHMKRGGRQYKAIIETLAPDLAWVKTQARVPTVRKTLLREPLFAPEYYAFLKKSLKGVVRQKFGRLGSHQVGISVSARHHAYANHAESINWLFSNGPYSDWFQCAGSMLTGGQYNRSSLDELLSAARKPNFGRIQVLGRIVNQEFAFRKVHGSIDSNNV